MQYISGSKMKPKYSNISIQNQNYWSVSEYTISYQTSEISKAKIAITISYRTSEISKAKIAITISYRTSDISKAKINKYLNISKKNLNVR